MKTLEELTYRYQCMEQVSPNLTAFATEVLNTLTDYLKPMITGNDEGELSIIWIKRGVFSDSILNVQVEPDNTLLWVMTERDIWTGEVTDALKTQLNKFLPD
jgi:hypothetical protein